jgi:hypothetical protein
MTTTNDGESQRVEEATALLLERGIPANAREFRLRQEFTRHGWDVRVRNESGVWSVHAVKSGRAEVMSRGSTEANAVRLALVSALQADEAIPS